MIPTTGNILTLYCAKKASAHLPLFPMKTSRAIATNLRFFLIAATVGLLFAACSPPFDPATAPISAATPDSFTRWKNAAYEKLTYAEQLEFDECINQVRLRISMNNEAKGEAARAQALCSRINGKTIREVMVMACTSEAEWVAKELARQRENLAKADAVIDGPGSESSKVGARAFRVAVADTVGKLEARQARVRARLDELQK